MNERTIWIVRIVGIALILVLLVLLMSLHSKLVRLEREQRRPKSGSGAAVLPGTVAAGGEGRACLESS